MEVFRLSAYQVEGSIMDMFIFARNYAKEVYGLRDVFEHLLPGRYVFEMSSHDL